MEVGLLALGAGIAVGLAALASGLAMSRIGAAGMGLLAEKPNMLGTVLVFLVIPETIVILGFAVAAMIIFLLGG